MKCNGMPLLLVLVKSTQSGLPRLLPDHKWRDTIMHRSISIVTTVLLLLPGGCEKPAAEPASDTASASKESDWIVSDQMITVENGTIYEGRPTVSEEVEREIYRSLNHRRRMMSSIQKNSGPQHAMQQMSDELELLTQGFMGRYGLSRAEVDAILQKGDAAGWQ